MNDTDLRSIEHLDFDPDLEESTSTAVPCAGYIGRNSLTGAITDINRECPEPPILIATRRCCGVRLHLCLDCFNWYCNYYSDRSQVLHVRCDTVNTGQPFLENLEWM